MSDISTKLTYLNTTKSQLKDMINYGLPIEEQITSSTTFKNYVSSIFNAFLESLNNPSTLFNNLPKITGSGSNITLNDTANAPMRIFPYPSELTQDGTPTPDSPQDIHTISGSNKVVVEGKNLLSDNFNDYTLSTGNYGYIQVSKENEPLILSITDKDTSVDISGCYFGFTYTGYNSSTGLNWILNGGSTPVATSVGNTQRNLQYISFYPKNEATFNKIFSRFNVMVEKGNTATTYEPYTSQEADIDLGDLEYSKMPNTNYSDVFIRTSGKNSIPFTNQNFTLNNVHYFVQDGSLILNGTSTSETSSKNTNFKNNFNFTLEAGTYTISHKTGVVGAYLYNYDNDSSSIVTLATNTASATFTLNEETKVYIGFYVYQNNFSNINTELMISKVGGDYEPYGTNEWYIKKSVTKIESYNGETITTTYMSTTGGLDTGATVYYGTNTLTYTKITGTLAEQLEYVYQLMKSYKGVTNISQINNDLPFDLDVSALEDLNV